MEGVPYFADSFYGSNQLPDNLIRLSHLNNKSSVLCPENQNITSQFLALQQLEAHEQMVSRAKSTVDTSVPKSQQSYISVTNRQRKKSFQKSQYETIISNAEESSSYQFPTVPSPEGENRTLENDSALNKGIQTGIPFTTFATKTDDKIAWYLEALSKGEFQYPMAANTCRNEHLQSRQMTSGRRVVKGDIMDWHRDSFVRAKKPFSPRILAHSSAKSKVREMRCYNPPFRKRKGSSSHSSDTFESYDQDDASEEESESEKSLDGLSIEEETLVNRVQSARNNMLHVRNPVPQSSRAEGFEHINQSNTLDRNEEDKYLSFLGKVTEDILGSGVYSDRAIQQAFEFHMQFYQDNNKEKLQSLLNQVLDGLKISSDISEAGPNHRPPILIDFSRSETPPEKDSIKESISQIETELNSKTNKELNLSSITTNQNMNDSFSCNQSIPPEELHTLAQDES